MKIISIIALLLALSACGHMPTTEVKSTAGDDYSDNGKVEDPDA